MNLKMEEEMNKPKLFKLLALFAVVSLTLAACGGGAATATQASSKQVTSTGFECPVPENKAQVTSKELNLFVRRQSQPG
jgi:ABC-type glycerol-3-phosphate transport system substrate-binding protein